MPLQTIVVDTSVIVRYLTGDDKEQSPAATELFRAAQAGRVKLILPTSTIQETVYVLEKFYGFDAGEIAPKLLSLIAIPNITAPDSGWVVEALQMYRTRNIDFGDALLCAYAHHHGFDIATFDKGILKKFPEVSSFTPSDWVKGKGAR